jgi:hypothetical protein
VVTGPSSSRALLQFGLVVFLSSFLLFQLEPMAAKAMLPLFGGSASVWTACMLFFQLLLLAGYALSHFSATRLSGRVSRYLHVALAAAAVAVAWAWLLPSASGRQAEYALPEFSIIGILLFHIGLPFLVLSASGPIVQEWSKSAIDGTRVYRLFALSNAGSLTALLTYPFLVEPFLPLGTQSFMWSILFSAFVALLAHLAITRQGAGEASPAGGEASPAASEVAPTEADASPIATHSRLLWITLSCCGAVMLLAATNRMAMDVPAAPFLWVIPLAVYLVTFMICFASERAYSRRTWLTALPIGAIFALAGSGSGMIRGALALIVFHSVTLFMCCMVCHGELALMKPASKHLTGYYLAIAAGGALGGALVSLVAPVVFDSLWEGNLCWIAVYATALAVLYVDRRSRYYRGRPQAAWLMFGIGLAILAFVAVDAGVTYGSGAIHCERTFHGVLRVDEVETAEGDTARRLRNGGIIHGLQLQSPEGRAMPTAYYGVTSGVGRAVTVLRSIGGPDTEAPLAVGVVGLGAGVQAAYGRPGDRIRFYELDQEVVDIAHEYFTFLADSPADIEIVTGDARLSMERELARGEAQQFDLLVLDAFAGDAVPLHLVTREAFEVYKRHLKPGGVLAAHISSVFLHLQPLMRGTAEAIGLKCAWVVDNPPRGVVSRSEWALMTESDEFLSHPMILMGVREPEPGSVPLVFTDERSSLVELLGR